MLMEKEIEEKTKRLEEFEQKYLGSVDDRGWTRIFDWTPGAWQTHHAYDTEESVLAYPTVYACVTLIQNDIAKLKIGIQRFQNNIWQDVPYRLDSLYRRPNKYQNQIQFKAHWMNSKLVHGNTYALKFKLNGQVDELHILDPLKVTPLISESGEVFYRLSEDRLTRVIDGEIANAVIAGEQFVVPASEIIHDRFNCLYHPLVGLSPIFAAGTAATMGLKAQNNSKNFVANGSQPEAY